MVPLHRKDREYEVRIRCPELSRKRDLNSSLRGERGYLDVPTIVHVMVYAQPFRTYLQAVILTLNKLQTNAAALAVIRERKDNRQVSEPKKMQQYLLRVGLTAADLQQLNAIHVSGTKGKVCVRYTVHTICSVQCYPIMSVCLQLQGSVCAMTESILRSHGFKTGLFV